MIFPLVWKTLLPLFRRRIALIEGSGNLPREGGFLLAANHIDYLDGFFLTAAVGHDRPRLVKFLSETNNYWWTGATTIQVSRAEKAHSLDLARSALENGSIICVFAEGRRNATDVLLPGRTGLARLAHWTGATVVPVGMSGPSGKNFASSCATLLFHRKPVTIRFGPPMVFTRLAPELVTKELLLATTVSVMSAVGRLCNKTPSS